MTGGLQQFNRVLESVQPIDVEFYLNASEEAWNAEMTRRYGDDWETIDG
jgi:hypothetical protein